MLSMKTRTQQGPNSALPALKFLVCFEQRVPHVYFALTPCKFCHWSWAPGELLVRKGTFSPSFTYLPYQIHQQTELPVSPTHFLTPPIALPLPRALLDQTAPLEPTSKAVFQKNFLDKNK